MKITNKVTETSYIQWVEKFVKDVLEKAELQCNEVTIEDIEFSKRIFLTIDEEEYDIRTWDFTPVGTDANGETCAENVIYTLYKMVDDENGSHGEVVFEGNVKIEWRNESEEYTYKLLRIFDIEYDDKNAVKSADYEIIMEFNVFVHDEETESMLTTLCKMKELPEDSYYIVQYKENKPCRVVAMFFYNPTDNTYGSYLDNCAEYNFRVIASAALDCDIV